MVHVFVGDQVMNKIFSDFSSLLSGHGKVLYSTSVV